MVRGGGGGDIMKHGVTFLSTTVKETRERVILACEALVINASGRSFLRPRESMRPRAPQAGERPWH